MRIIILEYGRYLSPEENSTECEIICHKSSKMLPKFCYDRLPYKY
jgi:hypothetical protein